AEARVDPGRVAMPDVDHRALDRPARLRVDHGEPQRQRRPGPAVGDVAPKLLLRDVVRAFGLLGREDAGDGITRERVVGAATERPGTDRRGRSTGGTPEGAPCQSTVHTGHRTSRI